jgi:outer membrane protein assembly factor BamB
MHRFAFVVSLLSVLATLSGPAAAQSKSWPWFRGADRTGVSKETGLLQEWPKDGPAVVVEAK